MRIFTLKVKKIFVWLRNDVANGQTQIGFELLFALMACFKILHLPPCGIWYWLVSLKNVLLTQWICVMADSFHKSTVWPGTGTGIACHWLFGCWFNWRARAGFGIWLVTGSGKCGWDYGRILCHYFGRIPSNYWFFRMAICVPLGGNLECWSSYS